MFLYDLNGDRLPELVSGSFGVFWNRSMVRPKAAFEVSQSTGYSPLKVSFTYTGDLGGDPEGKILWDFGDGGTAEGLQVTHTFQSTGKWARKFFVTVTARNREGTARSETRITVYPEFRFDFVAVWDSYNPRCNTFSATEDSSPYVQSAFCTFGDGTFSSELTPTHCYEVSGDYQVSCTAEGPLPGVPGNTVTVTKTVKVDYYFIRGDANGDRRVDIGDVVELARYLEFRTDDKACQDAFDTNDDGILNFKDLTYLVNYLFMRSYPIKPPPPPFPEPGVDPTMDSLIRCGPWEYR